MSDLSRTRRGDFERRQRQLPADKRARRAKGKAWSKARADQEKTPLGAPPKPVDVRSVYDTRPINAFDFNISDSATTEASVTTQVILSFQVPEGFVCVLRNFDVWFEPNPVILNKSEILWSLQLNGGDFPYNLSIPMGIAVDRETCFMIANEFNTVGVRITGAVPGASQPFATGFAFARFYGNFLLKSGLPASLEIGNLVPTVMIPPKKAPPPRQEPPKPPTPEPPPRPTDRFRSPQPQQPMPGTGPFVAHADTSRRRR